MIDRNLPHTAILFLILLGASVARAEPLLWGVSATEPWSLSAQNPAGPGISQDILAELSRRSGQEFRLIVQPFARTLQGLRDNKLAFALSFRTPGAEDYSVYPICLFTTPIIVMARTGFHVKKLPDLAALPQGIGVIRGVAYGPEFDNDTRIKKSEESDFPQMLRKLLAGRLDGVAGSTVMLNYHILREGPAAAAILGDRLPLSTVEICIQVPKNRADDAATQTIIRAAQTMIDDKSAEAVVSRYVGFGW